MLKLPRLNRTRQSLPPSPSVAVRAEQGPGAGDHLPAPPAPAALLTQRCSWPWERRLETLGYPWAAAASGPGRPDWSRRSRGPSSPQLLRGSGSPWSLGAQPGHSRRVPGASCRGAGGRAAPRPPACHCRRPSTRDRGRRSSGERAWQCAPEPPGVKLWRPRRAWTGRGRASRSQPPGVCPASVSQFCNLRARDLSQSWRSFWFYT